MADICSEILEYTAEEIGGIIMGFEISKTGALSRYIPEPGVKDVVIPDNINGINKTAFKDIEGITSIQIGPNVNKITVWGFIGCSDLMNINVSLDNEYFSSRDGILYDKKGTELLFFPQGRTEAVIPDGVKGIGNDAFSKAYKLKSITLPDTVKIIGKNAFLYTGIETFTAPKSLKTICSSAFSNCLSLKKVMLSASLSDIFEFAFSGCTALKQIIFNEGIKTIGSYTFPRCSALEEIVFPQSLKKVEKNAFKECDSLSDVTFLNPDTILELESFPEKILSEFVKVKSSKSSKEIKYYKAVKVADAASDLLIIAKKKEIDDCFDIDDGMLLRYTAPEKANEIIDEYGNVAEYIANTNKAPSWAKVKIPEGVKIIQTNAFMDDYSIQSVIIPEGVEEIRIEAFSCCLFLEKISLPASIKNIGESILYGCGNIEMIEFFKNGKKQQLKLHWLDDDMLEGPTKQMDLIFQFIISETKEKCELIIDKISDKEVSEKLKKICYSVF